ncbi:Superfamily I DNA or RNA helicase [Andreprevotia lacus DSM 23236]|jgi:superfamily I DNA/RNA helicase|uniref:DNA 3'-5' helicase II n=1 Tax=Andreprevotia lacus DSM 23236 TaxID=1121001 RepID=A0A1W1XW33_9NEIS|nr:UvrD-helicase domain-containing protein [Andreprevotia lacus]SMC27728.1 Superfamily I DNA or RNA helicase [Andreprevotia lacus DSM 23236]
MSDIKITDELQVLLDACAGLRRDMNAAIVVHGRAGTGKTTALLLCQQQLAGQGLKVLPMAFSRRGVQRFNDKQQAMFGPNASLPECVSIESFVLTCLKDHSLLKRWEGGKINARLDDPEAAKATMRLAVTALNERYAATDEHELLPARDDDLRFYLELISNLKISLTFEDAPFKWLDINGELSDEDEADIHDALRGLHLPAYAFSLFCRYENCRRDATYLGRGDAAYDLAREPDAIGRWCRESKVDVVLVDEFHDTKAAHFQIIKAMIDYGVSVIAMGDPAQDIFEFRGIGPFNAVTRLSSQTENVLSLTRSYRYGREIARLVETQLALAEEQDTGLRAATHKSAYIPLALPYSLPLLCRELLARAEQEDLNDGEQPIAILTPAAEQAIPVMRGLLLAGIPVQAGPGMPRCDLVDVMQIMRIIARLAGWASTPLSIGDALALGVFIQQPGLKLSTMELRQLEDMLIDQHGTQRGQSHELTYRLDAVSDVLALLRKKLGISTDLPLSMTALDTTLQRLAVLKYLQDRAVTQASRQGADFLLMDATHRLSELGGDGFVAELDLLRERSMLGRGVQKILVSSVLQAKGMEWRVVIMPPLAWSTNRNQTLLERRERYVACSRARVRIYC